MNNYIEVIAVVEGKTEEIFINSLLKPYLAQKMIFMTATQVTKPGQKGGGMFDLSVCEQILKSISSNVLIPM